jgi:Uma2 family endonuclease
MSVPPRPQTRRHPRVPAPARLQFGPRAPLTDRLFLRLCRANPDLRLERTATGELIIMPPAGSGSGGRNLKVAQQLANWVDASGQGVAFDSSAGFTLPNGAIRSPDASWVARDRWDALTPDEQEGFAPLCPDFVVELRSPTDRLPDLRDKMREYRAQGARLGWLIDPKRCSFGRRVKTVRLMPGWAADQWALGRRTVLSGVDTDRGRGEARPVGRW